MSDNESYLTGLFERYLAGKLTSRELDELLAHFGRDEYAHLLKTLIRQRFEQPLTEIVPPSRLNSLVNRMDDHVLQRTKPAHKPAVRWHTLAIRLLPYAAVVLLALTVGIWLYTDNTRQPSTSNIATDIPPGGNRATLTLADGRNIELDSAKSSIVIGESDITYADGAQLTALPPKKDNQPHLPDGTYTLTTPRGGQYQVVLQDGTTVWLNAASTLRYPSHFDADERVVELLGEGYFSVAHDPERPFRVRSRGQIVEVLGTAFNISAYPDDPDVRTTLEAGSVRLIAVPESGGKGTPTSDPVVLAPGEQAIIRGTIFDIRKVDTELYTSWKSGYFYFKNTPLADILRQAARWYDIDVEYRGPVPRETFTGDLSRHVTLQGLLEILQRSTINVDLEGRTLIIYNQLNLKTE